MHTYRGPKGTIFSFNSDMSGEVRIRGSDGTRLIVNHESEHVVQRGAVIVDAIAELNGEDLVAFVTHWLTNYRSDPSPVYSADDTIPLFTEYQRGRVHYVCRVCAKLAAERADAERFKSEDLLAAHAHIEEHVERDPGAVAPEALERLRREVALCRGDG